MRKILIRNGFVAATYALIGLALPATALANFRLSTALYALAVWDPRLIVGLALGNAITGIPQGPVDIALGFLVGLLTSWACAKVGSTWAPIAVLVIPTLIVPIWLSVLFHVPYGAVVPALLIGQSLSALLAIVLLKSRVLEEQVKL